MKPVRPQAETTALILLETESFAANVELEGRPPHVQVRYSRLIEFFLLLAVGMAGWVLCSPVLPIPADKHLRAISIALGEMLFLVGLGCLAARRAGFAPSALRRRLAGGNLAPSLMELIYAAAGAAALSILGTRVAQMIVVKALWSPSLAATAAASIKEAGLKAFDLFKAHPLAVGVGFPIIEEIHFRLFLMTVMVWLIAKLSRAPAGTLERQGMVDGDRNPGPVIRRGSRGDRRGHALVGAARGADAARAARRRGNRTRLRLLALGLGDFDSRSRDGRLERALLPDALRPRLAGGCDSACEGRFRDCVYRGAWKRAGDQAPISELRNPLPRRVP